MKFSVGRSTLPACFTMRRRLCPGAISSDARQIRAPCSPIATSAFDKTCDFPMPVAPVHQRQLAGPEHNSIPGFAPRQAITQLFAVGRPEQIYDRVGKGSCAHQLGRVKRPRRLETLPDLLAADASLPPLLEILAREVYASAAME